MNIVRNLVLAGVLAISSPALADGVASQMAAPAHTARYDLAVRFLKDTGAADAMAENI
jgi:hypothetical protein